MGEIIEWMTDPTKPSIYVLDGIAGIGKSTVAQTIAERCAELGNLGASFFFSRTEDSRKTAKLFFSTLAFHLAHYDEGFADRIATALEQTPEASGVILKQQLQYLLIDPLHDLIWNKPIVIVIDAMDECKETDATELLGLLAVGIQELPNFKIFITTRPEPYLQEVLRKYEGYKLVHLHEIQASVVKSDISLYLAHELSFEKVQQVFPGDEWQPTANEFNTLVEGAGDLFIIASTMIRFILDKKERDPQSQMVTLLDALGKGTHFDVTAVLDQIYLQILQSGVLNGTDVERNIRNFQKVIGTILVLENPLPLDTLAAFLGMKKYRLETVLLPLHSIIAPRSIDQAPQIYHKSFPDFITDPKRCTEDKLYIVPDKHHAEAAMYCFNVMNTELHQNMYNLQGVQQFKLNKDIEAEGLATNGINAEVGYACAYWATHLKKSGENNKETLVKLLKTFAFTHLLHWLEILSLLGKLDVAHPSLVMGQEYMVSQVLL